MKIIIIFLIVFSFYGCKNYNSKEYIENENIVIKEIIPQLIQFDNGANWNKLDTKPKVFLSEKLFVVYKPKVNHEDIYRQSEKEEKRLKKIKETEMKNFRPFALNLIKERKLKYKIEYPNLKIEYVEENVKIKKFKENEYGHLVISRIIFNKNFDTGYLAYSFFCGTACAWGYTVEIKKINGKWEITETYSGGIA